MRRSARLRSAGSAIAIAASIGLGWGLGLAPARAAALEVGDQAPAFSLAGSDGRVHRSTDLVGHRAFVLAWFPRAFSPGCTAELEDLRDSGGALGAYDVDVFMVSTDPPEKNAAFAKSVGTAQVLLSDPDGSTAAAYGVGGPDALLAKRWTFYVDRGGVVRAIDTEVSTATAGADIARRLGELGFPKRP